VLGVPGTGELILKKIPLSIFIPLVAGQQMIEILPKGVRDFPVLHFLLVFDFISHFYQ
jgi:hypothetical protein